MNRETRSPVCSPFNRSLLIRQRNVKATKEWGSIDMGYRKGLCYVCFVHRLVIVMFSCFVHIMITRDIKVLWTPGNHSYTRVSFSHSMENQLYTHIRARSGEFISVADLPPWSMYWLQITAAEMSTFPQEKCSYWPLCADSLPSTYTVRTQRLTTAFSRNPSSNGENSNISRASLMSSHWFPQFCSLLKFSWWTRITAPSVWWAAMDRIAPSTV